MRGGDGSSHARTKPVTHRGMPRKFRRMIVAHWPPFSPHRRENADVKALAPTSANPVIIRNTAIAIPAMPRCATDTYATEEARRRYVIVYSTVFMPPRLRYINRLYRNPRRQSGHSTFSRVRIFITHSTGCTDKSPSPEIPVEAWSRITFVTLSARSLGTKISILLWIV